MLHLPKIGSEDPGIGISLNPLFFSFLKEEKR
jgi:hypothetical protein